jgi:hypothetical protein
VNIFEEMGIKKQMKKLILTDSEHYFQFFSCAKNGLKWLLLQQ